jgi:hypothetical protein
MPFGHFKLNILLKWVFCLSPYSTLGWNFKLPFGN